ALGAVTADSAAILGVDGRIGSLAVGLDGDVVLWDSHPIGTYARTVAVLVDGAVVLSR
ncbi:MAG: amidohydrolase family protein, partial [Acidobacteria bacterium]|nr:amidohydrolase family protein [Acidobacteriota bacterium]